MTNCDVKGGNLVREKQIPDTSQILPKTLLPPGFTFPTEVLHYYISLLLLYLTSRMTASILATQISIASWVTFAVWGESNVLGSFLTSTYCLSYN